MFWKNHRHFQILLTSHVDETARKASQTPGYVLVRGFLPGILFSAQRSPLRNIICRLPLAAEQSGQCIGWAGVFESRQRLDGRRDVR
jgi:hypothetical protein